MSNIEFTVQSVPTSLGRVMVHLQGTDSEAQQYSLVVPSEHVLQVFDPHRNCPAGNGLDAYLFELVSEIGTFMMGAFVDSARKILGVESGYYEWVVASVDEIKQTPNGIVVSGKVVPFDPD